MPFNNTLIQVVREEGCINEKHMMYRQQMLQFFMSREPCFDNNTIIFIEFRRSPLKLDVVI